MRAALCLSLESRRIGPNTPCVGVTDRFRTSALDRRGCEGAEDETAREDGEEGPLLDRFCIPAETGGSLVPNILPNIPRARLRIVLWTTISSTCGGVAVVMRLIPCE